MSITREEILCAIGKYSNARFELGRILNEFSDSGKYREWGFEDFADYCKKELWLGRKEAAIIIGEFKMSRRDS